MLTLDGFSVSVPRPRLLRLPPAPLMTPVMRTAPAGLAPKAGVVVICRVWARASSPSPLTRLIAPGQGQLACERGDVAGSARASDRGQAAGVVGGLGGQIDRPAPGVISPARQQAAREREALAADVAVPGANNIAERLVGASRGRVPRVALQEQGRAFVNDRARVRARGAKRAVFADYQRALGHGGHAPVGIRAGARQQQVVVADLGEAGGLTRGAADHARDRQAAGQPLDLTGGGQSGVAGIVFTTVSSSR